VVVTWLTVGMHVIKEFIRYKLVVNRLKTKNLVMWNPNKEA
jgi:hypothetical protein